MSSEAEIRLKGMQALIDALGLVDAERFTAASSKDRFDYTQWRRQELPTLNLEDFALAANQHSRETDTRKNC
jgi:hypothetical protein